jgi:hypothetical protein
MIVLAWVIFAISILFTLKRFCDIYCEEIGIIETLFSISFGLLVFMFSGSYIWGWF